MLANYVRLLSFRVETHQPELLDHDQLVCDFARWKGLLPMKTAKIISTSAHARDVKVYLEDADGTDVDISDYVLGCTIDIQPGEINRAVITMPLEFDLSVEVKDIIQISTMSTRPACPHCGLHTLTGDCEAVLPYGYRTTCENTGCYAGVYLDETLTELVGHP